MQPYLFVNPLSGSYDRNVMNQTVSRLKSAGLEPTVFPVTAPAEIYARCSIINEAGTDSLVMVAGGDGTINAVVNGLQSGYATLAVLPAGTSNVLAAELGIKTVGEGVDRILNGKTRPLSVGLIHFEGISRRFLLMAGIGLDGAVVRDVRPLGKRLMKQGAYALSAFANACRWDRSLIRVVASERETECHSVIVCNAARYGGDFILAPGEEVFSLGLTAICMRENSRRSYLKLVCGMLRGKACSGAELVRIQDGGIEIEGTKPIQIDGDFAGYSPARITTEPDFARIIV